MTPHKINELDNFICGWYMQDPSLCDSIINYFQNSPDRTSGKVNTDSGPVVDTNIKSCEQCVLDFNQPLFHQYMSHLQEAIDLYGEKYKFSVRQGVFRNNEPVNVQYYKPTDAYYSWHCERSNNIQPMVSRHLVFMTYLNDVTDSGETEFYYQKLKIKPEKGLTLLWGSDWTFTHRGIPSPSQEKYVVTGWLHFY